MDGKSFACGLMDLIVGSLKDALFSSNSSSTLDLCISLRGLDLGLSLLLRSVKGKSAILFLKL